MKLFPTWFPKAMALAAFIALGSQGALVLEMPAQILRRGDYHQEQKDYSAALQDYAQAATLDPGYALPYQRMGSIYLRQGRLEEAEECLNKALALDPQETEALTALGQVLFQRGRGEEAIALWEKATALSPRAATAHQALGIAALERGDFSAAEEELSQALELDPSLWESRYRLALLKAREAPHEAQEMLQALLKEPLPKPQKARASSFLVALRGLPASRDLIARALSLGIAYLKVDALSLAGDRFRWVCSQAPQKTEAQAHEAYVLFRQGFRGKAVRELDRVIKLDPHNAIAHYYLGLVLLWWGNAEGALEQFQEVLRIDPQNAAAFAEMGRAYYYKKDYERAAEMLEKAARLAPNDLGFHLILARFYLNHLWLVEERGLPAAIQAARIDPQNAEAQDLLGWAYYLTERYQEAEDALQRALALDPDLASAHYHLGMTYIQTDQKVKALQPLRRAVDLDSGGFYRKRALFQLLSLEEPS